MIDVYNIVTPSQCREASEEEWSTLLRIHGRLRRSIRALWMWRSIFRGERPVIPLWVVCVHCASCVNQHSQTILCITLFQRNSGGMLCTGRTISPPILSPITYCHRPVCCQSPSPRHMLPVIGWCSGCRVFGICVEAYSGTDDNDACLFH